MELVALVAAAVIAERVTPHAAALALRARCVAHPSPHVPTHTRAMPLLGGVAIVAGVAPWIAIAAAIDPRWCALPAALIPIAALGVYKDRVQAPVSPIAQLAVQAAAAACLWWGGLRVGARAGAIDLAATVALVVAIVNAWNFLDVIDGLAASVAAPAAIALAALGDRAAALVAIALAGAALGYLRHNWPPARVFMGDLGSFGLGATFAALVLAGGGRTRAASLLALIVPLGELAFTIASRIAAGRSPLRGGGEHASLRLLRRGWPSARIDTLAGAITAAAGLAAWAVAGSRW